MARSRIVALKEAVVVCAVVLASANAALGQPACKSHWDVAIGRPGASNHVRAMTVYDGDLIAGGAFVSAGGQTVNYIARWDGAQWHPLESNGQIGVNGIVTAMIVHEGSLFVGGLFSTAGGQTVNFVARWDGESWHALSSGGQIGVAAAAIGAFAVYKGDLIVGGSIGSAGGQALNNIARWDGQAWHPLGSPPYDGVSPYPKPPFPAVTSLTEYEGDLIVGGAFTHAGGQVARSIARWNGSAWHPFVSGDSNGFLGATLSAMTVFDGELIVSGTFILVAGHYYWYIARWDGADWQPIVANDEVGLSGSVNAFVEWQGDLIAAGYFVSAGGQEMNRIARWDGTNWHPLESGGQVGVGGQNAWIFALTQYNNDLIVGGNFTLTGGEAVERIASWRMPASAHAADLNCDGIVDVLDLLILLGAWGPCPKAGPCPADLNNSGTVDVQDLLILLGNWG